LIFFVFVSHNKPEDYSIYPPPLHEIKSAQSVISQFVKQRNILKSNELPLYEESRGTGSVDGQGNNTVDLAKIIGLFPFLFAPIWELAPTLEHRADFSVS
jgi:hypothetical protein